MWFELLVKVRAATDAINCSKVQVPKYLSSDVSKPIDIVKEKFVETNGGKIILTAMRVAHRRLENPPA